MDWKGKYFPTRDIAARLQSARGDRIYARTQDWATIIFHRRGVQTQQIGDISPPFYSATTRPTSDRSVANR
jgi:hypothetical protein